MITAAEATARNRADAAAAALAARRAAVDLAEYLLAVQSCCQTGGGQGTIPEDHANVTRKAAAAQDAVRGLLRVLADRHDTDDKGNQVTP